MASRTLISSSEENEIIRLCEVQFDYKDEDNHSLRLHLLKEGFMEEFPKVGESLGLLCIRKLFNMTFVDD